MEVTNSEYVTLSNISSRVLNLANTVQSDSWLCDYVRVSSEQPTYQEIPRPFYCQSFNFFEIHNCPVLDASPRQMNLLRIVVMYVVRIYISY